MASARTPSEVARAYIVGSHGSLPHINFDELDGLLADDFSLEQEGVVSDKAGLRAKFEGWQSIVDGKSVAKIHTIAESGDVALAHWETDYDIKSKDQVWYGTDVDISGKQMSGFTVFASFKVNSEGKIVNIIQRSDDVVRKLGIEEAVFNYRKNQQKAAPKKDAAPKKEGKKEKGKKEEKPAEEPTQKTPEQLEEEKKKKAKKVWKEGGKRGVEIEGAADMGGLKYFCTSVDEPEGDMALLTSCMEAMNQKSDPTEEERKGGSGRIGKMIFSAGDHQLAIVAYVPEDEKDNCDAKDWLKVVLANFAGEMLPESTGLLAKGVVKTDSNNNKFPLKMKEPSIMEAINYLKKKGLFPDKDDSDDEMVFGDDDFPS